MSSHCAAALLGALLLAILASAGAPPARADSPPAVAIDSPTEVSFASAHLSGTVNPNGGPSSTFWHFELSENGEPGSFFQFDGGGELSGPEAEGNAPVAVSSDPSLLPGKTYFVRLVASNEEGGNVSATEAPHPSFATKEVPAPAVTLAAPTGVTGNSAEFAGTIKPGGTDDAFDVSYRFECTPACPGAESGFFLPADEAIHAVSALAAGLQSNRDYEVRLIATNLGGEASASEAFKTLAAGPGVFTKAVHGPVAATTAQLMGAVDPNNTNTSYWFEYGLEDCASNPCSSAPVGRDANAGADDGNRLVVQTVTGLASGATYHYRLVADNGVGGPVFGADQTFTTAADPPPPPPASQRGFEMVSPPQKGNNNVYDVSRGFRSSESGDAAIFVSKGAFGDHPSSNAGQVPYRALRGSSLPWTSADVSVPFLQRGSGVPHPIVWSSDLRYELISTELALTSDGVPGADHFYLRDNDTEELTLVSPGMAPGTPGEVELRFAGATPDLSQILFETGQSLVAGAPAGVLSTYEWRRGEPLRLVTILPDPDGSGPLTEEPAPSGGYTLTQVSGQGFAQDLHPISQDGSRVFWISPDPSAIVMREGGFSTYISASQRSVPDPDGPGTKDFIGATPSGSKAFFTSCEKLTDDATSQCSSLKDLYRYDVASGELTDLSVSTTGVSAGVLGLVGYGDDGEDVYFAAEGEIVPGADEAEDGTAEPAIETYARLYHWREGELTFVATLDSYEQGIARENNWRSSDQPGMETDSRVSPNGRFVVFAATRPVTGYATNGLKQFYRYDSVTKSLACVSCNPRAGQATSAATIGAPGDGFQGGAAAPFKTRQLTDRGQVFFSTADPLVSADSNGKYDVYEWYGAPHLVSDGQSPQNSYFADASLSGDDVFFWTTARLSDFDRDDNQDAYDARVGGGDPDLPPPPPGCEGDACQRPPIAPSDPTPASSTFRGHGNHSSPQRKRCAKGRRVAKRAGKARCVKRKGAKSHRHSKKTTRSNG